MSKSFSATQPVKLISSRNRYLTAFFGLILLIAGCVAVKEEKVNKSEILNDTTKEILKDKIFITKEIKLFNQNETIDDRHPVFSPDGTKIVFESDRADGIMNLWIMDADGNNLKQLTFNKLGAYDPAFSPDGNKLLFTAGEAEEITDIWVMNIDGTNLRQITTAKDYGSSFAPAWSPDEENIAYISGISGAYAVWVMKSSGKEPHRLTKGGAGDWGPTWSLDGKVIAYASRRDGIKEIMVPSFDLQRHSRSINTGDVWLVNVKDKSYQQLTTDMNIDVLPAFSPDGSKIIFFSERGGSYDIWIMNSDGGNQEQFTNGIWEKWKPLIDIKFDSNQGMAYFYMSWSPDSRNIAFTKVRENGKGDIGIIIMDIVKR